MIKLQVSFLIIVGVAVFAFFGAKMNVAYFIYSPSLKANSNLSKKEKTNFIIVFCDNLGYGDIEPFGSKVNRIPSLIRMAQEGRKFSHFYVTAGVCTPSRSSIMTGCYSQRIGMHWNPRDGIVLRPISPYGLNPDEITVAEVLKEEGYSTGIIGKWHLGDQKEFLPTAQGFDYFYGIPYSDDMTQEVGERLGKKFRGEEWPPLPVMLNQKVVEEGVDRNQLTQTYTKKALEFIKNNKDSPFFLYLPHAMPGSTKKPFASVQFRGKSKGGAWGDSVEELDWSVGQILDKLVELEIDEKTLVIFTSDNGAPMTNDPSGITIGTNQPLNGRGYTTSEGGFRVPNIMWWPGTIPKWSVSDVFATTMDFLPTFAGLADAKVPVDRIIDGYDISSLLTEDKLVETPYKAFFYYYSDQLQAVRWDRWKLFLPLEEFEQHPHFKSTNDSEPLLFDLENDISSTRNLADSHPEIVRYMMSLATDAREDLGDKDHPGANQRKRAKLNIRFQ